MDTRINIFQVQDFESPEEEAFSCMFSVGQTKYLRRELATVATEKALLSFDPECPEKLKFENEYLRGKIEMLMYMLAMSESRRQQLEVTPMRKSNNVPTEQQED